MPFQGVKILDIMRLLHRNSFVDYQRSLRVTIEGVEPMGTEYPRVAEAMEIAGAAAVYGLRAAAVGLAPLACRLPEPEVMNRPLPSFKSLRRIGACVTFAVSGIVTAIDAHDAIPVGPISTVEATGEWLTEFNQGFMQIGRP